MVYTDDSPDVLTVSFTKGKNVRKNTENSTLLFSYRQDKGKHTHCIKKAIPFHNKEQDGRRGYFKCPLTDISLTW